VIKKLFLLLALAAVAVGSLAGSATAASPAPTTLTIKVQNGDFSGTIKSSKVRCYTNRTVHLMKVVSGPDQRIASDTVERQGNKGVWSTGNTGLEGGRYYAKVAPKSGCKGAVSRTLASDRPVFEE
jgi:hypothetical protein